MKSKLYFLHIHKVGGNSLVKVLRKGYSENEILPVGLWREIIALPREEIMRYRFFSGHFGTETERAVRRFQARFARSRHKLTVDGVAGPKTQAALRRRYGWQVWKAHHR